MVLLLSIKRSVYFLQTKVVTLYFALDQAQELFSTKPLKLRSAVAPKRKQSRGKTRPNEFGSMTARKGDKMRYTVIYCDILRYTAIYCDILRYTAIYCDILRYTAIYCDILRYTAIYCDTLRYTAIYCLARGQEHQRMISISTFYSQLNFWLCYFRSDF